MTAPAASERRDYRWRISMKRSDWAEIMSKLSEEIVYTNFKDELTKHPDQHDKLNSYLIVWSIMLRCQKLEKPGKPPEDPPKIFPDDWGGQTKL
jgi:hypothetical protein